MGHSFLVLIWQQLLKARRQSNFTSSLPVFKMVPVKMSFYLNFLLKIILIYPLVQFLNMFIYD